MSLALVPVVMTTSVRRTLIAPVRCTLITPVRRRPLAAVLLLTVLFSWTVWTVGVLGFGVTLPAVLLGAWGPSIAAVVVTGTVGGRSAVRSLVSRFDPRVRGRWYALAVGLPFLAAGVAFAGFLALGGRHTVSLPGDLPMVALPVVLVVNVVVGGALAEELGWRGVVLPALRSRYGTFGAGVGVGLLWAFWHLPLYVLPGVGLAVAGFPFVWFVPVVVGYSLVMAWLADRTGHALAPAVVFHAATNTAAGSLALVPVDDPVALLAYVLSLGALVAVLWTVSPSVSRDRWWPAGVGDVRDDC